MTADPKGRGLFIVDNSVSGWTGLRYLEEWAGIAKAFDIATGYFEIGALLALDGQWQSLDNIRILMGAETTYRTRTALLDAVRGRAVQILDGSLEENKGTNPFLAQNQSSRHGPPSGGPDFQRPSNRAPATRVGVSKSLLGRCLCGFEASRTRRASTTSARRDRARPGVVSCSRFSSGATRNGEMRRQIGW